MSCIWTLTSLGIDPGSPDLKPEVRACLTDYTQMSGMGCSNLMCTCYSVEMHEHSKLTVPDLSSLLVERYCTQGLGCLKLLCVYIYILCCFLSLELNLSSDKLSLVLFCSSSLFFFSPIFLLFSFYLASLSSKISQSICTENKHKKRGQKLFVLFRAVACFLLLKIISFCFSIFSSLETI